MIYKKKHLKLFGLLAALMLIGCTPSQTPSTQEPTSEEAVIENSTAAVQSTEHTTPTETATETLETPPIETQEEDTTEALPEETQPDILENPVSYDSLGIDAEKRQAFHETVNRDTALPVISISTDGTPIVSRESYVPCVVDVLHNQEDYCLQEASAGIKVRGNSSAQFGNEEEILKNTVPYRIKFFDETNMLGLNEGILCKNWVLLKSDWDLIRNDIAFRFGRSILGADNYCSDAQLVHLYINEKFIGIYLLCEQNEVHPGRVNISIPQPGYTGTDIGYFLEIDNYAWEEKNGKHFTMYYADATLTDLQGTTRKLESSEYSIKSDIYSTEQETFIATYINNVYTILYEACVNGNYLAFDDNYQPIPSAYHSASEVAEALLDLESVVDLYILQEIAHDYDCGEGSFYMCIDFSEDSTCPQLRFTCPWDYNWAYYDDAAGQYYAAAFNAESFVSQFGDRSHPWFILLMTQDWFVELVKEKWTLLRTQGTFEQCIQVENDLIETYWDDLNAVDDWATYCSYDLITWIETRIQWLDTQWLKQ